MNQTLGKSTKVCTEIWCFWPLTASTTLEVKNDHAHVITQDICNKQLGCNDSLSIANFSKAQLAFLQLIHACPF